MSVSVGSQVQEMLSPVVGALPIHTEPPTYRVPGLDIEFMRKPWAHQVEGIKRALEYGHFGFFFDLGTGKTFTAINTLRAIYEAHGVLLKTLIVSPLVTLRNWEREFHQASRIPKSRIIVLDQKSGVKKLVAFKDHRMTPHIFIVNYESLIQHNMADAVSGWKPEVLVLDESHRCKEFSAKRTKLMIKLAKTANYRFLLTGTPVLNSALDLFAQFLILDRGETFGTSYTAFRSRYFVNKNADNYHARYPDWQLRRAAIEELKQLASVKTLAVKKQECMDLPPLVTQRFEFYLSPEQRGHYDLIKKHLITFIEGKACTAAIALTKVLRMLQITSGFMPLDDGSEDGEVHAFKENPRRDCLEDLLEDVARKSKVIVWAAFRHNYKDIRFVCDKLGLPFVELHGETPSHMRQANIDSFNTDPSIRVLIGNPGSGGIGVNLVSSDTAIFYSRTWSLEHDAQAEARNHRGGSEVHKKITRIDIVCKNTIEEKVCEILAQKKELGEQLLVDQILEGLK